MFKQIPSYFFLDIIFATFIFLPVLIFKHRTIDIVYLSLFMLIFDFVMVFNAHYYVLFSDVFSLSYLSLVGEGMNLFTMDYLKWGFIAFGIIAFIFFLTTLILFRIFYKIPYVSKKYIGRAALVMACSLVVSSGSYFLSSHLVTNYEVNVKKNQGAGLISLARGNNFRLYGPLTYYTKEVLVPSYLDDDVLKPYFSIKRNTYNEFTGLLEGYNVIEIMIETGAREMLNEYLTPNLYRLTSEGIHFINNYSKNKTNISEIIGIMGSYSTEGLNFSKKNYAFPFAIPNMLPENYTSFFAHNVPESKDIYQRQDFMNNFGFDKTYFNEELTPEQTWDWDDYVLDTDTIMGLIGGNGVLENIQSPFYGFWTTLSMHGSYGSSWNYFSTGTSGKLVDEGYFQRLEVAKRANKWKNPLEGDENGNDKCIDNYMMAVMCFDDSLGMLLDYLEEKGMLSNTLLVLYGDHEIYYNGASGDDKLNFLLSGRDSFDYYDIYGTELVFYNPVLNEKFNEVYPEWKDGVTTFTSPLVIVPSILDLLGINYNANFYIGNSVFSPQFKSEIPLFYSYELSRCFNDKFMSRDLNNITMYYNEEDANDELLKMRILSSIREFALKQISLDSIYSKNPFYDEDKSMKEIFEEWSY
ncbi:MAG TPA: hypothetical protein DCY93_00035 [Firmicutes bacterium]|nr:hypothetical protein [Bacillota bacterium]